MGDAIDMVGDSDRERSLTVCKLDADDAVCEAYTRSVPEGKLSHTLAWSRMISRSFNHRAFYLVARAGEQIRGVLPLTHVRSRIFGNRLISQAFSNYGGILTGCSTASGALYERAIELAQGLGCESVEFRNVTPLDRNLYLRTDKVCMLLPLTGDPEGLRRGFSSEIRNRIRKAQKSGLTAVSGGLEYLNDFYRVWTARMRQLGTPCFSKRLFKTILETFPQNSRLFLVRLGSLAVGAAMTTVFNGLAEIPWVATLTEYNGLAPNSLLYWSVLEHYCRDGAGYFDFGRSTVDSSTYEFKRRWGTQRISLHYQYWVRPGHEISILSPENPRYQRRVEMWRRLPLWATRIIGPLISRSLP